MENIYKAVMRSEKTGHAFFVEVGEEFERKHVRLDKDSYRGYPEEMQENIKKKYKLDMWDTEESNYRSLQGHDPHDWLYFISFNGNLTLETIPDAAEPAQEEQGHTFKQTALASIELLCNSGMKITNVTTALDEECGKITITYKKEK